MASWGGRFLTDIFFKEGHPMSRVATPQTAKPSIPTTPGINVPHEKIAMRAYEKWVKRGCPQGTDKQDWIEAEAELKAEYARNSGNQGMKR
jgi:Protein of unknown function (DUF2934)